jgi:serine/threonine protein kinase
MKESQHPNVVNFLEAFLVKNTELWVVMEYMEGGALTDVIENNKLAEDQIASICLEVSMGRNQDRTMYRLTDSDVPWTAASALAFNHPSRHQIRQSAHERLRRGQDQ